MTSKNRELKKAPELTFEHIKNAVIVNVLSVVTSSIVLGAAVILWGDNESAKLRMGYLASHVRTLENKVEKLESDVKKRGGGSTITSTPD